MKHQPNRSRKISENCYLWALADAHEQLNSGFPMVGLVRGAQPTRFLAYVDGLARPEALALIDTMVKRFHPDAAARLGDKISSHEQRPLDTKDTALLKPLLSQREFFPSHSTNGPPRMHRSRFATLARKQLRTVLGAPVLQRGVTHWYVSQLGAFRVRTQVSLGKPSSYMQSIESAHGERFIEFISLLSWLGISAQTYWDLARAGDEADVARSIAFRAQYFVDAAKRLVE